MPGPAFQPPSGRTKRTLTITTTALTSLPIRQFIATTELADDTIQAPDLPAVFHDALTFVISVSSFLFSSLSI